VIAWKFLNAGRVGPFTGFRWPIGEWVSAPEGAAEDRLIHACRTSDLPYWVPGAPDAELWRVELDEPVVALRWQVASMRGRLLQRVEAWGTAVEQELRRDCSAQARRLGAAAAGVVDPGIVEQYVETTETWNAGCGMFALVQLARTIGGDAAGEAERARQASWIAARLELR
jgi:hypothetical protein